MIEGSMKRLKISIWSSICEHLQTVKTNVLILKNAVFQKVSKGNNK